MDYVILQISREAYDEVRARIVAVDQGTGGHGIYERDYIRPPTRSYPELLVLGSVALQALEPGEVPRVGGGHYVEPPAVAAQARDAHRWRTLLSQKDPEERVYFTAAVDHVARPVAKGDQN